MKKITLALALMLTSLAASAQNFYNFSTFQQTYADLESPVSINNGTVWQYDAYGTFTMPFAFKYRGLTINRFMFSDDDFVLLTPGSDYATDEDYTDGAYGFIASNIFIQDRTFASQTSSSPISYKVEGTTGNRILKLEVKNATVEDADFYDYASDYFYTSFQFWFFEADNSIEIHYGANNIADIDTLTDGEGLFIGFGDDDIYSILSGSINAPTYGEYPDDSFAENPLSAYPANGTVYRFTPASAANIPTVVANNISLYPNPAKNILNIKSGNEPVTSYTILDVTGKVVAQSSVASADSVSVNVENLAGGVYFVKVNNSAARKFVKK